MGLPSMSTAWFGEYKGEQFQNLVPSKSYDPENPYADPVAKLEHRDAVVRAKFVHVAKCQVCVLRGAFPLPPPTACVEPFPSRLMGAGQQDWILRVGLCLNSCIQPVHHRTQTPKQFFWSGVRSGRLLRERDTGMCG